MIQSVHIGDDAELVRDILDLYARGPRVLDMTYGHGGFWRYARSSERTVIGLDKRIGTDAIDQERKPELVTKLVAGDYLALPFADRSFDAVTFDPPFITHPGNGSKMADRYTSFDTYDELLDSCAGARDEALRVLVAGGVAVVKCMDWVEGRTVWRWLHFDLMCSWTSTSRFRLVDLLINARPTSLRNPNVQRQTHAKRAHTYFLVFQAVRRLRSGPRGLGSRAAALGSGPGSRLGSRDPALAERSLDPALGSSAAANEPNSRSTGRNARDIGRNARATSQGSLQQVSP